MISQHAALLLAAGGSRRLGQPKQLLPRDGVPLIRHSALLALATQPARLVVVLGDEAPTMQHALQGLPLDTIVNTDWSSGMAGSLRTGVRALAGHTGALLVLGVDQPALDSGHLHALLSAFDDSRDVVSAYADTIGIPAVLRPQTVARANELDGDRGFGALLRSAIPAPHTVPNESLALDIDTGDALALARQAGWVDRH